MQSSVCKLLKTQTGGGQCGEADTVDEQAQVRIPALFHFDSDPNESRHQKHKSSGVLGHM